MDSQLDTVVLIHGFGGKRLWMAPLAFRLARKYQLLNWSYFSYRGSIDEHGARLAEFIDNIETKNRINIVAHSMGSIVTRAALQKTQTNIHRVVMLAPPNYGSHIARFADPILGPICRPIRQLSSRENSYVNQLPDTTPCETGVIASKYDVLVPVKNTLMEDLADHQTVFGTHNSLLFSGRIAKMTTQFIQTGKFAG